MASSASLLSPFMNILHFTTHHTSFSSSCHHYYETSVTHSHDLLQSHKILILSSHIRSWRVLYISCVYLIYQSEQIDPSSILPHHHLKCPKHDCHTGHSVIFCHSHLNVIFFWHNRMKRMNSLSVSSFFLSLNQIFIIFWCHMTK